MALRYEVGPFEPAHATVHARVISHAYAAIPQHARPAHDEAFHQRIHDASNPAGASLVAIAWDGKHAAGMISAVPARFRTRDARLLTAYQPTALVVDPTRRTRGINSIGFRLVRAIVSASAERGRSLVYAYPNERSIGIAERVGFARVHTVPTYLFPSIRLSADVADSFRGRDGRRWVLERVRDPVELRGVIPGDAPEDATGFIRDRAYFEWRFGGPAAARYTLVFCRAGDPRDSFVIACTEHRMKGFPFTILVDGYPAAFLRHFDTAIRAASVAAGRRGPRVVYVSTNLASIHVGARQAFPKGIGVPARFHPRPINLLYYPTLENPGPEDLRSALAMTGDWMGF